MTTNRAPGERDWLAPAKINLFLRVLGKRDDGYHRLDTRLQFLALADRLRFAEGEPGVVRRIDRHDFPLPEADLCVRAARLLRAACARASAYGVTITLSKTLPPSSGLGGGSSNAATTLLALNHRWRLGFSRAQLAELGLQLGADVPLFVHGRAARARGIGEELTPDTPPERWLCVCLPAVEVSTARVFAEFAEFAPGVTAARHPAPGNDLESVTTRLYPAIGEALAQLRHHAPHARMSGSGGALYADFDSRAQASALAARLPPHLNPTLTHSRNHHPLLRLG